jgi:uncharacterized linocin/CFP29 family protein
VFEGYSAASITGLRAASSHQSQPMPTNPTEYLALVGGMVSTLRRSGAEGPYALVLHSAAYAAASSTTEYGMPVLQRLTTIVGGEVLWSDATGEAVLASARGGDFTLYVGQDASIGYLSHDADSVTLYLQESLTFVVHTPEAVVATNSLG